MKLGLTLVVAATLPLLLAADTLEPLKAGMWEETLTTTGASGKFPSGRPPNIGSVEVKKNCIKPGTTIRDYVQQRSGKACVSLESSVVNSVTKTLRIEMACKNEAIAGSMLVDGSWASDHFDLMLDATIVPNGGNEASKATAQSKVSARYVGECASEREKMDALPPPPSVKMKRKPKKR